MSQVLYRKWRPTRLAEVVGQDHITRTLRQAVVQGRVAHAYLFCGPRGTGKTSTARILAKAVNCLSPSDGEPCNQCHPCEAVNEGRALDLVEIDAASQRRIDDIRNLREKVHFTPAEATYKVYIVDEVHMLTSEAFNALLKTLEEPPSHAIFVLATTEAYNVPATVISRCQRFDFHRISHEHIETRLALICEGEGVEAEPQVLRAIARNASGSLRDAENMLEQLMVSYGSNIALAHVRELLGLGDDELALDLVKHILKGEAQEGLRTINGVADRGIDMRRFHRQVVDYLRGVLLLRAGVADALEHTPEALEAMNGISESCTLEQVLRAVRIFEQATPKQDGPATLPLELALVDCCLDSETVRQGPRTTAGTVAQTRTSPPRESRQETPREVRSDPAPRERPAPSPAVPPPSPTPANPAEPVEVEGVALQAEGTHTEQVSTGGNLPDAQWDALRRATKTLKINKFNIGSLLLDCVSRYVEGDTLVLVFKSSPNMERLEQELENPQTRRLLQEAVEQATGTPYALRLNLATQGNGGSGRSGGHMVRQARALGVQIVGEEEKPRE